MTRVVTAHLPDELAEQLDTLAASLERSRGWVVKRALQDYLDWEAEKLRMTRAAIASVNEEGTIPHEEVVAYFEARFAGGSPERPRPRKS